MKKKDHKILKAQFSSMPVDQLTDEIMMLCEKNEDAQKYFLYKYQISKIDWTKVSDKIERCFSGSRINFIKAKAEFSQFIKICSEPEPIAKVGLHYFEILADLLSYTNSNLVYKEIIFVIKASLQAVSQIEDNMHYKKQFFTVIHFLPEHADAWIYEMFDVYTYYFDDMEDITI